MIWRCWNPLGLCLLAICCGALCSSRAAAQQISELAIGAARVGTLTGRSGATYDYGPVVRGSIGAVILPHVRVSGEISGIAFLRPEEQFESCLSTGQCAQNWGGTLAGLVGVSGSAQVDLDSDGRFYGSVGAGVYEEFLFRNSSHLGYSGGIGMVLPVSGRRVAVEVNWLQLTSSVGAATRALPISAVFRF